MYLRAPTTGAMEALRRVTRFVLETKDAYTKLRTEWRYRFGGTGGLLRQRLGRCFSVAKVAERWQCGRRRMPSGVFLKKASSGTAEHYAMRSTAEEPLHMRSVLEYF